MTRFLTPVALDFLWESVAAGELPYPLEARSHGTTIDERTQLRHQVFAELRASSLVDSLGRPSPLVEDWLRLLTSAPQSIDSVSGDLASLAVSDGTLALLATQSTEGLQLTRIDPSSLASSIVAQLPPHPRGKEQSITVPATELAALSAGRPAGRSEADRQVLKALSTQPKLRGGQLAVNSRTQMGTKKRSPVLSWFDTEEGRYLTYSNPTPDGANWITIAPADAPTLRHRLGELLRTVSPHPMY